MQPKRQSWWWLCLCNRKKIPINAAGRRGWWPCLAHGPSLALSPKPWWHRWVSSTRSLSIACISWQKLSRSWNRKILLAMFRPTVELWATASCALCKGMLCLNVHTVLHCLSRWQRERHLQVLLGVPGLGKTTLLTRLKELVLERLKRDGEWLSNIKGFRECLMSCLDTDVPYIFCLVRVNFLFASVCLLKCMRIAQEVHCQDSDVGSAG